MPDCRWVVDTKYYSASKVSAHDVDKLLSDKKSHRAEIGILMVYMDGSCSLRISPNVQKMAEQHGILIVPYTGQNPDKNCMAHLKMIKKRANFSPQVQKSMKLIDAGQEEDEVQGESKQHRNRRCSREFKLQNGECTGRRWSWCETFIEP